VGFRVVVGTPVACLNILPALLGPMLGDLPTFLGLELKSRTTLAGRSRSLLIFWEGKRRVLVSTSIPIPERGRKYVVLPSVQRQEN
jgi:hypothetical protein